MNTSVQVAVRIRKLSNDDTVCVTVIPNESKIILVNDEFVFDYVYDTVAQQADLYDNCVGRLVERSIEGYNAAVLAYGQTGSGKTFTMGFENDLQNIELEGMVPRALRHLFSRIEEMKNHKFIVEAQFMELHNEKIIDLLDPNNKSTVKIQDTPGGMCVTGVTVIPLEGLSDAIRCLQQGSRARTTASTKMNAQSSRSHALFSILIRHQLVKSTLSDMPEDDSETLMSKFHFVDLAGSERLQKAGAIGTSAKEGISINLGLLALGKVISALVEKKSHIPYRDSKLTHILKDSLSGNSQTLMIACISPSDRDVLETLSTLKYANRARSIKNRVQINKDQSVRTISSLERKIAMLETDKKRMAQRINELTEINVEAVKKSKHRPNSPFPVPLDIDKPSQPPFPAIWDDSLQEEEESDQSASGSSLSLPATVNIDEPSQEEEVDQPTSRSSSSLSETLGIGPAKQQAKLFCLAKINEICPVRKIVRRRKRNRKSQCFLRWEDSWEDEIKISTSGVTSVQHTDLNTAKYQVKKILGRRELNGKRQCLVSWENSWEDEGNLNLSMKESD